jgi:hypothetical protein
MKIPPLRFVAILLLVPACLGKSDSFAASSLVRVQGVVKGPLGDDFCPAAEITFTSKHLSKVTTSDRTGFYQVDLPADLYTMTTRYQILIGKTPHFMKQTRPLFRASSRRLVLNVRMFAERWNCDIGVANKSGEPVTREQWEAVAKNLCGYEDQFAISAEDGTPYELLIKYPKSDRTDLLYQAEC